MTINASTTCVIITDSDYDAAVTGIVNARGEFMFGFVTRGTSGESLDDHPNLEVGLSWRFEDSVQVDLYLDRSAIGSFSVTLGRVDLSADAESVIAGVQLWVESGSNTFGIEVF